VTNETAFEDEDEDENEEEDGIELVGDRIGAGKDGQGIQ